LRKENFDYEKTEDDLKKIKEYKDTLERTRAHFNRARPDNFYEKIDEDRIRKLQEQVILARHQKSEH